MGCRRAPIRIAVALLVTAGALRCAEAPLEPAPAGPPPPGSALAAIEVGMSDLEVKQRLGEPDHGSTFLTDRAWWLFYWGSDIHRAEWVYEGEGRVIFRVNRRSGALRVIQVIYEPAATGPEPGPSE